MRAALEGHVVPVKQQAEWMSLVSTQTREPIADVSADNPQGYSLGLARGMFAALGPHWYYRGDMLGYRTLYVWFEQDNLMLTVQTNSQPGDDGNKLRDLVAAIYAIVHHEAK